MDLTDEELEVTRLRRNYIKYTKLIATGKGLTQEQFKDFYNAYCELYDIACYYMDKYNNMELSEQFIEKNINELRKCIF